MKFAPWTVVGIRNTQLQISTAAADDHEWVFQLAERHKRQQGFWPDAAFAKVIREGRILITRLDGERIGYTATSGGMITPAVLRMNTVKEDYRDRGFGTCQTLASMLWAYERTRHYTYQIRTRTDIERQIKINSLLGGKVIDDGRNEFSKRGESIQTIEFNLIDVVRRYDRGDFNR